jgi:hypothetical protein
MVSTNIILFRNLVLNHHQAYEKSHRLKGRIGAEDVASQDARIGLMQLQLGGSKSRPHINTVAVTFADANPLRPNQLGMGLQPALLNRRPVREVQLVHELKLFTPRRHDPGWVQIFARCRGCPRRRQSSTRPAPSRKKHRPRRC